MSREGKGFLHGFGRLHAMTVESFRETRGPALPVLILAGAAFFAAVGHRIPSPMGVSGSLAGAWFSGGLAFLLAVSAMVLGAWSLAADRRSGFSSLLLSKPVSGPLYFLGRFLGISVRLTLIAAAAGLAGGFILLVFTPEVSFSRVAAPTGFREGNRDLALETSLLLAPGGAPARWTFRMPEGTGRSDGTARFQFRPRYPRDKPFVAALPVQVTVRRGEKILRSERIVIRNRKSLTLPFPVSGTGIVEVELAVTGGHNFLEIAGGGCALVQGRSGALTAMLCSVLAILPVAYLSLAAALVLSTFVSVPTALLSSAVLGLLVLMGPSLRMELRMAATVGKAPTHHVPGPVQAPHEQPPEGEGRLFRWAARFAEEVLSLLPDPRAGGCVAPLTRMERPGGTDLLAPWRECLIHLAVLSALGCLLAGRRRL